MRWLPCFETNKLLEAAARRAEQRKNQAISELSKKLGCSRPATTEPVDARPSASFISTPPPRCENGR